MQYRALGKSGLKVSVLSFGAWQIGDPEYWGADPAADADAAVGAALDAGINLFDTAESYGKGEAERALGKALGARRKDVLIASKFSAEHARPEDLRAACEGSLKRLGTDWIDLYQVHWPVRDVPLAEVHGTLAQLRQEGKIREVGLSNHGPKDIGEWMQGGLAVSNQLGYNIIFRAIEYEVAPACRRNSLGILVYMPLMQGLLSGRWEWVADVPLMRRRTRHFSSLRAETRHDEPGVETETIALVRQLKKGSESLGIPMARICLAWILAQPGVASAIIGARNPGQLRENLPAADLRIAPGVMAKLNELSYPLKRMLGANADLWQSGQDSRIR